MGMLVVEIKQEGGRNVYSPTAEEQASDRWGRIVGGEYHEVRAGRIRARREEKGWGGHKDSKV